MIDTEKRISRQKEKERIRSRMRTKIDPNNYQYIPEKHRPDFRDNDIPMKVAIYVRVSTDDVRQTTSFELQSKYYEDFVVKHPSWTLVKIYADEGISGTSLKHRDSFNQMIEDCRAHKIDMIITKSVSRFARNVLITVGVARDLAELQPPVGVFFESECLYSLNENSAMNLTFQATMAEEESHTRSRSMEASLRMRLDNGIPLTPKLLGFSHDMEGNLVINEEEAPTAKLAFYMYLYGYSTKQIADAFIALGRRSYLGNIKWTSNSIVQILRNERYCGEVLTRKTFTPDFRNHLAKKNRGERPQSRYLNHHEPIVSRDDFIAVQRLLDNAKYKNRSLLPELRVIDEGLFKGFVIVNPRWAGFKEAEYLMAAQTVYPSFSGEDVTGDETEMKIPVPAGSFDFRGFEIARAELFDSTNPASVLFSPKKIKFNTTVVRKYADKNTVELLVNPVERKFAIRSTDKNNRHGVVVSKVLNGIYYPREIATTAFGSTLYQLLGWDTDRKYKITGSLYEEGKEIGCIFSAVDAEAILKPHAIEATDESGKKIEPLLPSGRNIRAVPKEWSVSFGKPYYLHEQSLKALSGQSEQDWKMRMEGQIFETGCPIKVTGFDELKDFISSELKGYLPENTFQQ